MNQLNPDFKEELHSMSRMEVSEHLVHMAVASLVHRGDHLDLTQKIDVINAALKLHRDAVAAEMLKTMTSHHKPYDVLTGDEVGKILPALITRAVISADDMMPKMADRLANLMMLFDSAPEKGGAEVRSPGPVFR